MLARIFKPRISMMVRMMRITMKRMISKNDEEDGNDDKD